MSARLVVALVFSACALSACECDATEAPPPEQLDDVQRLQAVLTEDPAQLVLDEVDDAVARQRPVIAADLIEDAAIPAVRRHLRAVQTLDMQTPRGHSFRTRAGRLLRARITALEHWHDALARGIGHDDDQLIDALHETAEAERAISELMLELAAVRPLDTSGPTGADREGALEGLPPLVPPTSGDGDDTVTPPDEPDPHGADPIDGTEDLTEPPAPPSLRGPHEPELPEDREDHHTHEAPPR